jgi:hypothetical protein
VKRGNPHTIIGKGFDKFPEHINKKGRPKKLPPLDELLAEVLGTNGEGKSEAERILDSLLIKALKGDTRAAEILLERGYGKVSQNIDIKGSIVLNFDSDDSKA